jgi:hypothetical protein
MQQRRVRLGDILDDYCPRERRVTNHVVVAMIEDEVKQTRCSTCDADHEYKEAKVPAQRRRKAEGALASDGEADGRPELVAAAAAEPEDDVSDPAESPDSIETPVLAAAAEPPVEADAEEAPGDRAADDVWVHRPLIRATLPRPEGHVPERKEPDFTMRSAGRFDGNNRSNGQRQNRGFRPQRQAQPGQFSNPRGHSAGGGGGQQGERNGNRAPQPGQRSGGRPGGQGPRQGGGQGRGPKRGR